MENPPKFSSFVKKPKQVFAVANESHHGYSRAATRASEPSTANTRLPDGSAKRSKITDHIEADQPNIDSLYFNDRQGDSGNIEFGTNSTSDVPSHYGSRFNRAIGDVIGNHPRFEPSPLRSLKGYDGNSLAATFNPTSILQVAAVKASVQLADNEIVDYISIEPYHSNDGSVSADDDPTGYLSDFDGPSKSEALWKKGGRLRDLTKAEPQNMQAWRSLIKFQRNIVLESCTSQRLLQAQTHAIARLRIAIYIDAITKLDQKHPSRERFLIEMMEEYSNVWSSQKVIAKWLEAISENPSYFDLHLEFLNFLQTRPDGFSYDICQKHYANYLYRLKTTEVLGLTDRIQRQTYAVLRYTTLSKDCGYLEKSFAVWQTLLELNLFTRDPPDEDDKMTRFEQFWNDEFARIGEVGSFGWCDSMTTHRGHPATSPKKRNYPSYRSWGLAEEQITLDAVIYDSSSDESEDPYEITLFSDIEPYLFQFGAETGREEMLIQAFLCFFQLPPFTTSYLFWWKDPLLRKINKDSNQIPFALPTFHSLFFGIWNWDDALDSTIAARILCHLISLKITSSILASYYLAFLTNVHPDRVEKESKRLIKESPGNATLYAAYACSKERRGDPSSAYRIVSAALNRLRSEEVDYYGNAILRLTAIWLQLSHEEALRVELISGTISTNEKVLETLIMARNRSLSLGSLQDAALFSELLMTETYIVSLKDLKAAMNACSDELEFFLDSWEGSATASGLLHQAQARLIEYGRHLPSFVPSLAKKVLRASLSSCPDNTYIADIYLTNEKRFLFDSWFHLDTAGILGGFYDLSITSAILLITKDMGECVSGRVTEHSIRSNFQKMASNRSIQKCEFFWMKWIFFEFKLQRWELIRSIFARGLDHVPWSKRFAMIAFGQEMSPMLPEESLMLIYNKLEDRGIRLRVQHSLSEV